MTLKLSDVEFGDIVRDSITGYEGVAIAKDSWITGCDRVGIQSKILKPDGNPSDVNWFDVARLVITEKKSQKLGRIGGPQQDPIISHNK